MINFEIIKNRKRLFVNNKANIWDKIESIKWAANNQYDTVVFSLNEKLSVNSKLIKLANRYSLNIEAGGHNFPLLLPKRLFIFNRDLFRMEHGTRKSAHHFCPTNPKTTSIITERAYNLFAGFMELVTVPRVFHLLPDKGHENTWCACPACRAFSPAEQNIIAVNTAADALLKLDPQACLLFFDIGAEHEPEPSPSKQTKGGITPRKNVLSNISLPSSA